MHLIILKSFPHSPFILYFCSILYLCTINKLPNDFESYRFGIQHQVTAEIITNQTAFLACPFFSAVDIRGVREHRCHLHHCHRTQGPQHRQEPRRLDFSLPRRSGAEDHMRPQSPNASAQHDLLSSSNVHYRRLFVKQNICHVQKMQVSYLREKNRSSKKMM